MASAAERIPVGLRPPVALALARSVNALPDPGSLGEDVQYEAKLDGFRTVIARDGEHTGLWSRQGKDLTRYLPELAAAAAELIPAGCLIDGEAVVWAAGRLDFELLQRRLIAGKDGLRILVHEHPASYAAFDVLCVAGQDTRALPLRDRRALLEELATVWAPPLSLTPVTRDPETAAQWFENLGEAALEGLVIKRADQPYESRRAWLKIKRRQELDIVCAAVIGPIGRPVEIVAGLPLGGRLRIVGRTAPLKPADSRALARWLRPATGDHPWPATVKGTTLDRFNRDAAPVAITRVEPIVVEVSADTAWSGRSFRHALRFLRPRPDLDPAEIAAPPDTPA